MQLSFKPVKMIKKKASTFGKSTTPLRVPLNDSRVTENEKHDGDFDDDLFEISNNTNNSNISQKSGNLFSYHSMLNF